jgi:hypothetical protein
MIGFLLRPIFWIIGLIFDAMLAVGIITFGTLSGLSFPIGTAGIITMLVLETHSVALGISAIVILAIGIAIWTRNDEDMQAELSKYRRRPRPLFGSHR